MHLVHVLLTIIVLVMMLANVAPPEFAFMIGVAIALVINLSGMILMKFKAIDFNIPVSSKTPKNIPAAIITAAIMANVLLTIIVLVMMLANVAPPEFAFMIGVAIALV
jgi:Mg2+/citrate symporter